MGKDGTRLIAHEGKNGNAARLPKVKVADEKKQLEGEIQQTDDQIDRLVYELYGLTDEEVTIVERA